MDPWCLRVVSDWMQNGNVMEYTKVNPKANRLQLVSPVAVFSHIRAISLITFSSLKSHPVRHTSTASESFMGISKGYFDHLLPTFHLADLLGRQTFSSMTTVPLALRILASRRSWLTSARFPCLRLPFPARGRFLGRVLNCCSIRTANQLASQTATRSEWLSTR